MFIERQLKTVIEAGSNFFPAILLTGPRQVGKTTFLRRMAEPERRYVTLDDVSLRTLAQEDPKGFIEKFAPPVLIDEIQYVPELLNYIKIVIDEPVFLLRASVFQNRSAHRQDQRSLHRMQQRSRKRQ